MLIRLIGAKSGLIGTKSGLKGKKTKIVLYTYDSILLDYDDEDDIIEQIKEVFKKYNLRIKTTKGLNYDKMI